MSFIRLHIYLSNSPRAIRLRLPEGSHKVLHWGRRIVQIGLMLLVLQVGTAYTYEYLITSAAKQQAQLYRKLQVLQHELGQVETQVRTTFHNEDLVHMKFGVTPPDKDVRELGYGGAINPDSQFLFQIHPVRQLRADLVGKMDQLEAQIVRSESSFTNISRHMEQQYSQLRHIPSVSPSSGRFSSGFGLRTHPVTGEREKMHFGIDVSNSRWTPIYATADGRVNLVKNSEYFGNYVVVNHGNGYETKYGHMEKPIVKEGQLVRRFDILGYMGRTGRTTGIHVHYEVWRGEDATNPVQYILSPEYSVE